MTPLVHRAEAFLRARLTKAAWWNIVAVMLVVALAAAACAAPTATPVPIPKVTVVVSDAGISVPAKLPAGPVAVTISNSRQAPRLLLFARLNAGVTSDQFMAALSTDQTGMAALALVSLLGGREVIPGASKSVTFDLKPGNYMVLDLAAMPPQIARFTVAAGSGGQRRPDRLSVHHAGADQGRRADLADREQGRPVELDVGAQAERGRDRAGRAGYDHKPDGAARSASLQGDGLVDAGERGRSGSG